MILNPYRFAGGAALLLDLYPNAAAAYSLRLLKSDYSGALVKIRRDSDDAEKDFYPDSNNELSLSSEDGSGTSLGTWIGANDGYVVTWYDQSGNTEDTTQSTSSDQPQIVSSGAVITKSGNPAIDFNSDFLEASSAVISANLWDIFTVSDIGGSVGNQEFLVSQNELTEAGRTAFIYKATSNKASFFANGAGAGSSSYDLDEYVLCSGYANNDDYYLQLNGNSTEEVVSNQNYTPSTEVTKIGGIAGRYVIGTVQEVIIYTANKDSERSDIRTNINDHYSIY